MRMMIAAMLLLACAVQAQELTLRNQSLAVSFDRAAGTLSVRDQRTGTVWTQSAASKEIVVGEASAAATIDLVLSQSSSKLAIRARIELDPQRPELLVTLDAAGPMPRTVPWPQPFVTAPGTYLVVPMNEGISYPVDDASIGEMRLVAYGGHGICMPFFGATDGEAGYMAILQTPDDAAIAIRRVNGLLTIVPEWQSQKGQFGYVRRIRYIFIDKGGHVAIAKRYREYARQTGLLKTLDEKRREIPAVDLLVGAVNIWCWERDPLAVIGELQAAGIQRILWSNRTTPQNLDQMNRLPGVLTSRYDIVQDVMNPENFPRLRGRPHPDWTTEAWPDDLMIDSRGEWVRGWEVQDKEGKRIPCGVLCDRQAVPYLDRRMAEELRTHAYRCRFIDTTTASPWRECYHPGHPQTRSESREYKMKLLELVGSKYKLVTGSETGHDAAVPYVHYFEGMLSLGPYRVPDAGRDMRRIWDEVPPRVAKFQLGHEYRLPLWELVYHDCVVAQWYWGDYNNKLPALWDKRDLFNALYGTPPMFMFDLALWRKDKDRFVKSYKATCDVARAVGYAEMTDHRFLAKDRSVQQTRFANGVTVTVDFAGGTLKVEGMK